MQSKTITTYLINGNPNGLRAVFISNKVCKALVVPRGDIEKIKTRDEAKRPSLYFLMSQNNESHVYIGESENFYDRLRNHQTEKDFWDVAISFFSQNNDLTKADVKYLEHLSLKTLNSKSLYNKKESTKPHLPEHQQSSVEEFFEDIKLITGFLGYNFFEKIEKKEENEIFYCKRSGIDAKGFYQDGKFIVLKGSKVVKNAISSYSGRSSETGIQKYNNNRISKINKNFDQLDEKFISLKENISFNSPSGASCFCLGMSSNGWTDWKNKDGKSLDSILRRNL